MEDSNGEPLRFEPDRLLSYDEDSILSEVKRAAGLLPDGPIASSAFEEVSRVSVSTCRRRFGSWRATLDRAGLGDRYVGPHNISEKMTRLTSRSMSNDEILEELRAIAARLGTDAISVKDVEHNSEHIGGGVIRSRFGSWQAALSAAGLRSRPHGNRWSEDDYLENLLAVWTHHGRAPTYAEMRQPPSLIGGSAYAKRYGSWGAAKHAFVDRVNSDLGVSKQAGAPAQRPTAALTSAPREKDEDRREIRLGLRYEVLRRDRFRCVTCGRSPATDAGCVLHVDHIIPFSRGGRTTAENLRSLCDRCNIGKGDRPA